MRLDIWGVGGLCNTGAMQLISVLLKGKGGWQHRPVLFHADVRSMLLAVSHCIAFEGTRPERRAVLHITNCTTLHHTMTPPHSKAFAWKDREAKKLAAAEEAVATATANAAACREATAAATEPLKE